MRPFKTSIVAEELPRHVLQNRTYWDSKADEYASAAERHWAQAVPTWGIWEVPESELHLLPERLEGADVIELGCGTAYVSGWLARRGAHPVGIDNSPQQLETARRMQREHGVTFPLVLGNAEEVPYPDGSFDLAISEYGAAIWCDPYRWIPETARLLRSGGELIALGNSALSMLCVPDLLTEGPATERLLPGQFGMRRLE